MKENRLRKGCGKLRRRVVSAYVKGKNPQMGKAEKGSKRIDR